MRAKHVLPEDKDLLAKLRKGDHSAFEYIYNTYSPTIYNSAYFLFRDREICEDLVQDLFADLWIKRKTLEIKALRPYLLKAIRNKVLMLVRSKKVLPDAKVLAQLARRYTLEVHVEERDIQSLLDNSVEKLPEKCRQIFRLSRQEHLSTREIARRLNLSPKTVENQLTIALRRLRVSLKDYLLWIGVALFSSWH